jgi:hypothetical protein
MNYEAIFVGAISVLLGLIGVIAAVANRDVCYQLEKIRKLEQRAGRSSARAVYAVVGVVLICLGIAIGLGVRPGIWTGEDRRAHHWRDLER